MDHLDAATLRQGTCRPPAPEGVALIVHGGAWAIPQDESAAHLDGLRQALDRGRTLLLAGAPALVAASETVAVLEGHGAFDAGCGAVLTRAGTAELDAGLMDGATLAYGGVLGTQRLAHPIRLALRLAQGDGSVRLLMGPAAEQHAARLGFPLIANEALRCDRERRRHAARIERQAGYHTSHPFLPETASEDTPSEATPGEETPDEATPQGTVGCVALDRRGHLAAATSTGGTPFRPEGRVGDSPLPGAGYYAQAAAAASATGWGEAITAMQLTVRATDAVAAGTAPADALAHYLRAMQQQVANPDGTGATGGLILLTPTGEAAWAYTTPRMARGCWHEGGEMWVGV